MIAFLHGQGHELRQTHQRLSATSSSVSSKVSVAVAVAVGVLVREMVSMWHQGTATAPGRSPKRGT